MEEEEKGTVCVTGGTGYAASWLIMRLRLHGYSVHATIRSDSAGYKKDMGFISNLEGALLKRLRIFNADVNKPESFKEAIERCMGVFHLAHTEEDEGVVTKLAVE